MPPEVHTLFGEIQSHMGKMALWATDVMNLHPWPKATSKAGLDLNHSGLLTYHAQMM